MASIQTQLVSKGGVSDDEATVSLSSRETYEWDVGNGGLGGLRRQAGREASFEALLRRTVSQVSKERRGSRELVSREPLICFQLGGCGGYKSQEYLSESWKKIMGKRESKYLTL